MKGLTSRRFKSLVDFRGSPHRLALAFGLGVALGIIPGTGALASAAVATLLRLNLPIMVAGALLTNPVTTPLVYGGSYLLGRWLFGDYLPTGMIARAVLGTLAGNLVLALTLGFIAYGVAFAAVILLRPRRFANS